MFFPFMIDVGEKNILVIGGGNVSLRKCMLFLDYGAHITVISPKLDPGFDAFKARITHICDVYRDEYLTDAFALIAASDDIEVNRRAADRAKALGIPVNAVDDPENCSFFIPAVVRRGDLSIGISTGGKSPALAGQIRRQLEEQFGEDFEERINILGKLREVLLSCEADPSRRRKLLMDAAQTDGPALTALVTEICQAYGATPLI